MTPAHRFELAPGLLVEDLGSECVVFVPGKTDVITLSGEAAHTLRTIQAGTPVSDTTLHLAQLVDLGILQTSTTMSRRGVVRAGMIGAGAGIAALAMPSVAAASSTPSGGGGGGGTFAISGSWRTGFGSFEAFAPWPSFRGEAPWNVANENPSDLTIPGVSVPIPFSQLYSFSGGTNNGAEWDTGTAGPPAGFVDGVRATFTVAGVPYSVDLFDGN